MRIPQQNIQTRTMPAAHTHAQQKSRGISLPAVPVLQQKEDLGDEKNNFPLKLPACVASTAAPPPVQRRTEIGDSVFDGPGMEMQRGFLGEVQRIMQRNGYSTTNKLLSVCIQSLKGAGVLHDQIFASEEAFVDFVADQGLASSNIKARSVTHRSFKLGKRPAFEAEINMLRKASDAGSAGTASRHVIPSHLLGFAAENLAEPDHELDDWIRAFRGGVSLDGGSSRRIKKRNIWKILHNHKGNLWAGDSMRNTAIGFVSGNIEAGIDAIMAAASFDERRAAVEAIRPPEGPGDLARHMEEVTAGAKGAFRAIVADSIMDNSTLDELYEELRDVWEQIEGDFAGFDMSAYHRTSVFLRAMESPTLAVLAEFMGHVFPGTYAS